MDLRNWLQGWLGIHDLHKKVDELESRMFQIEESIDSTLKHFGNYSKRTEPELLLMRSQLETLVETVSNMMAQL